MMQWESIQKYRTPSRSAHMTASLNVLGKSSRVILHIPSKALFDKVRGIPWVSTPVVAQSHVCRRPDIVAKTSAVTCPCLLSFISRNLTGSLTGCAGNPHSAASRTPQPTSAIEAAAADMDPCLLKCKCRQDRCRPSILPHFCIFDA
jgi:hypothetical protein